MHICITTELVGRKYLSLEHVEYCRECVGTMRRPTTITNAVIVLKDKRQKGEGNGCDVHVIQVAI